ncbi:MAG: nucleotide exchange factor GrpE [Gammaproteobacteria bacterium]
MSKKKDKSQVKDKSNDSTKSMAEALGVDREQVLGKTPSAEDLEKELDDMRQQAEDYHDKYLRAQAELQNARERMKRELDSTRKFATEKIIKDLLPIIDSLEKGLETCGGAENSAVSEGLALTHRLFLEALARFSVTVVDPQGEAFDAELHEAMGMQPSDEVASGHITLVIQKGYLLHDRLVRPARVMVAQ